MRTWLHNRLTGMTELPEEFRQAGKIISSGAADNPQPPFLVTSMNVEQPWFGMPRSVGAGTIPFTIWVHDTPGSMLLIDDGAYALKHYLPTEDGFMIGQLSVYQLKWDEIGEDSYDDHFNTNCRPVRFSMVTRR